MAQITTHFSYEELRCPCCGRCPMDMDYMEELEELRAAYGKPMVVSSGYRCPDHNDKVSSTGRNGPHTTGCAVDVLVSGHDAHLLTGLAFAHGFTGVGVSQKGEHGKRFIHLDRLHNANRPWIWSY